MRGKIQHISNDMSGLQTIKFEDGSEVSIENFGVRQMYSLLENPIGKTIDYEVGQFGIMSSFE
jgi:hypothetical protein